MKFPRPIENLIANLRSLPEDKNYSIDRPAWSLDTLLETLIQEYKIGDLRPEESLITHWRDIVGRMHADRCRPLRIEKERKLIVAVTNPILRQELKFKHNEIMERLKKIEGCEKIEKIVFKAG